VRVVRIQGRLQQVLAGALGVVARTAAERILLLYYRPAAADERKIWLRRNRAVVGHPDADRTAWRVVVGRQSQYYLQVLSPRGTYIMSHPCTTVVYIHVNVVSIQYPGLQRRRRSVVIIVYYRRNMILLRIPTAWRVVGLTAAGRIIFLFDFRTYILLKTSNGFIKFEQVLPPTLYHDIAFLGNIHFITNNSKCVFFFF